jgi:2-C-methyl-D-erythritol 2,4-cyclodiphosphate synthase
MSERRGDEKGRGRCCPLAADAILSRRRGDLRRHARDLPPDPDRRFRMRIGHGYDSHRFAEGRRLVLGGVEIPAERGLDGHSDADAVAHAVTDALLGAAGLGDIGRHFPPTDAQWKDADSILLLDRVVRLLEGRNYQVVNVDVTIVTEAPKIGPHVAAMQERLSQVLGISPDHISIKGKSNEGMGWIGRGEGLACFAVALIDAMESVDAVHARHRRDVSA